MKTRQLFFYATVIDLEPILKDFEIFYTVQYYKRGLFNTSDIPNYLSAFMLPDIGIVKNGDWNHIDQYIITNREKIPKPSSTLQKKGGIKYSIDQSNTKESLVFLLGGKYKEKVFIPGKIGTISNFDFSINSFTFLEKKIKKEFKKVGGFYVGLKAFDYLKSGMRFTTNVKSPIEYDLKLIR